MPAPIPLEANASAMQSTPGLSHPLGATIAAELRKDKVLFHLILNGYWEPLDFELPPLADGGANPWLRWIDTALETPNDIVPWEEAPAVQGLNYRAEARSVVALYARLQ